MMPETQSIARAMHDHGAEALANGYEALRQSLVKPAGELLMGASLRGIDNYMNKTDREQFRQRRENTQFILESASILPEFNTLKLPGRPDEQRYGKAMVQAYLQSAGCSHQGAVEINPINALRLSDKPENYLTLHGLTDRVIWASQKLDKSIFGKYDYRSPLFVVGTNPKLGIIAFEPGHKLHSPGGGRLYKLEGRQGRRLAKQYAIALKHIDTDNVKPFYESGSNSYLIHGYHKNATTVEKSQFEDVTLGVPDYDIHNYNILAHLMNLSALFGVESHYAEILDKYTQDAPVHEVRLLKGILEGHLDIGDLSELDARWSIYEEPIHASDEAHEETTTIDIKSLNKERRRNALRAIPEEGLRRKFPDIVIID